MKLGGPGEPQGTPLWTSPRPARTGSRVSHSLHPEAAPTCPGGVPAPCRPRAVPHRGPRRPGHLAGPHYSLTCRSAGPEGRGQRAEGRGQLQAASPRLAARLFTPQLVPARAPPATSAANREQRCCRRRQEGRATLPPSARHGEGPPPPPILPLSCVRPTSPMDREGQPTGSCLPGPACPSPPVLPAPCPAAGWEGFLGEADLTVPPGESRGCTPRLDTRLPSPLYTRPRGLSPPGRPGHKDPSPTVRAGPRPRPASSSSGGRRSLWGGA